MNDNEERAFRIAHDFYAKWRDEIIETDEQWMQFARDMEVMAADMNKEYSCIGQRLFEAVIDAFNDLYRNGNKPLPADYFGRDDL